MFLLFLDGQPVGSSDTVDSVPEGFEAIPVDEAPVTPVDSVGLTGSLLFFIQPNENTNTTSS